MMQNLSDEEFLRYKEKIQNGEPVVYLQPEGYIDHFKVGRTVISYALGVKLQKWHLTARPTLHGNILLIGGRMVEGGITMFDYHP